MYMTSLGLFRMFWPTWRNCFQLCETTFQMFGTSRFQMEVLKQAVLAFLWLKVYGKIKVDNEVKV